MANPLQQAVIRRKIYYVVGILALFTLSMVWRGKVSIPLSNEDRVKARQVLSILRPSERERFATRMEMGQEKDIFPEGPPAPSPGPVYSAADWLSSKTIEGQASPYALDLRELDQGDPEIAGTAVRLGLSGARGFVVTFLWKMAIDKQKRNEWAEFERYVRDVTRLQPHFITPWIYQSWNIAYNVSVENDRLNDMYFYISRGIELLAEGERLNKKSPDMRFQIGFYYQNKFGVSDKVNTLRCLMQLSCIRPEDRDSKKGLRKPDGTVNMPQFQDFCKKNPQLTRRLREKLSLKTPDEIITFLDDNSRVPSRYDLKSGRLADARSQFPVLPPAFLPDEYHAKSESMDDSFDAFHASRAWFEYSLLLLPPPTGEPEGIVKLTGEDQFKYRLPKAPALIIFRQGAARAQSYLAERLTKEGWFDVNTRWYPDERSDTEDERWFPRSSSMNVGPGEGLVATDSSLAQWRRAYERWKRHGELNGLVLDVAKIAQLERDSKNVPDEYNILERSDEQLARMGITRNQAKARKVMRDYELNRHMTNFAYFLGSSEAESDPMTVQAHEMLWNAQRMIAVSKPRAIELYASAIAKWWEVLLNYPKFHHPGESGGSDKTEEDSYELQLELVNLLDQSERIETRLNRLNQALRVLIPVDEQRFRRELSNQLSEREAGYMIAACDERVKRRAAELKLLPPDIKPGSMAYLDNPAIRDLVAKEFFWLPQYKTEAMEPTNKWISDFARNSVRVRLGLVRPSVLTETQDSHEAPPPPTPRTAPLPPPEKKSP